ncbi:MAG: hypothetical protein CMI13_11170 [Oleibacter sp.]|nr:hypothetical protein [Thalassolituus sp.]|tara:strand:+ start:554 stop:1093 length:540 start_codon:yes stop_codon:yes gene_type:complete
MSLDSVRSSIVTTIKNALPQLKTCSAHAGRFNLQELTRISHNSPAVFVACLGFTGTSGVGETSSTAAWAAYIVTAERSAADRDTTALKIASALATFMDGQTWDDDNVVEEPQNVSGQNLYSAALDKSGVALWAVTWRQAITVGTSTDIDELNDFLRYSAESFGEENNALIQTAGELPQD